MPEADALPAALAEAIGALSDAKFAASVRAVCSVAAGVIARLRETDLLKYEKYVATGTPDLSLWEEVAPVLRDTVVDVNSVLNAVRQHYPQPQGDLAGAVGKAIEEALGAAEATSRFEQRMEEVARQVRGVAEHLAAEVSNLGDRVRRPEVVADRWNLLTDLQEYRGRFRRSIGELVYAMVGPFSVASKAALIPGYAEEVLQAVALRRAVTDLARVMAVYARRVAQTAAEQTPELLAGLAKDLDRFGKAKAYSLLRAPDKHRVVEFRHYVERLSKAVVPGVARSAVEEFARLTTAFARINEREILKVHDRESMAQVAVKLEMAESLLPTDVGGAAAVLEEATAFAQGLYGRDGRLDEYLRKAAKRGAVPTEAAALRSEIAALRVKIADMPLP